MEQVHRAGEVLGRFELQDRHRAFTRLRGLVGKPAKAVVGHIDIGPRAIDLGRATTPGVKTRSRGTGLAQTRKTECHTDGAISKLVDVGEIQALAIAFSHAGIDAGALFAVVDGKRALGKVERSHRLQIHRARQALADQAAVRRLVDHHTAEQLRGVLIELDATAVARGHLFTTVQQSGRKIWRHAPNTDLLGTALGALCRQAWQTSHRLGDA